MNDHDLDPLVDRFNDLGASAFGQLGEVSAADDALLENMVEAGMAAGTGAAAGSTGAASQTGGLKLLVGFAVGAAVLVTAFVATRPEPEARPGPKAPVHAPVEEEPEAAPDPPAPAPAPSEPSVEVGTVLAPEAEPAPKPKPAEETAGKQEPSTPSVGSEHETAAELLLAANRASRGGERELARDLYRALARRFPGTREHLISRVALGDLELESFERPKPALAEYDAYLRAKPKGNLAEEALHGKARALDALGRRAEGEKAWTLLLERFPDSLHAPAARRRLDVR